MKFQSFFLALGQTDPGVKCASCINSHALELSRAVLVAKLASTRANIEGAGAGVAAALERAAGTPYCGVATGSRVHVKMPETPHTSGMMQACVWTRAGQDTPPTVSKGARSLSAGQVDPLRFQCSQHHLTAGSNARELAHLKTDKAPTQKAGDKMMPRRITRATSGPGELSLSDVAFSMDFEDEILEFEGWTLCLECQCQGKHGSMTR